jgi:hypothetical protein
MKMTRSYPARLLALLLGFLLAFNPVLAAAQSVEQPAAPHSIQIVILNDEGALNNIRQRDAREPIVQVQDENHKPVAGALLIFLINTGGNGAGGTFAGGLSSLTVTTNAAGQAVAHGFTWNGISGNFSISVHASSGNLSANSTISCSGGGGGGSSSNNSSGNNPPPSHGGVPHHGHLHWVLIGSAAAAGAGLLTFFVVHQTNNGTTITPGTGTVGGP